LLISVSIKSKYYWIFEAFLKKEYSICITIDILTEVIKCKSHYKLL